MRAKFSAHESTELNSVGLHQRGGLLLSANARCWCWCAGAGVLVLVYCRYRNFKCPAVFAVTDNELCISLKGYGWFRNEFIKKLRMPTFEASGMDMLEMWHVSKKALAWSRKHASPSMLIVHSIPRRFGHAATDRQDAYLTAEEITALSETNPLLGACSVAVEQGAITHQELYDMLGVRQKPMTNSSASQRALISSQQHLCNCRCVSVLRL